MFSGASPLPHGTPLACLFFCDIVTLAAQNLLRILSVFSVFLDATKCNISSTFVTSLLYIAFFVVLTGKKGGDVTLCYKQNRGVWRLGSIAGCVRCAKYCGAALPSASCFGGGHERHAPGGFRPRRMASPPASFLCPSSDKKTQSVLLKKYFKISALGALFFSNFSCSRFQGAHCLALFV